MNPYLYFCLIYMSVGMMNSCRMQIPEVTDQVRKSVSNGDTLQLFYIPSAARPNKTKDHLVYHGYRFGEINQTRGAVSGVALDGEYEFFYRKALIRKGSFQNGLKTGDWYHWDENGNLMSIEPYRNGELNGIVKQFDAEGTVTGFQRYRNNQKDGIGMYEEGDGRIFFKYKQGVATDTLQSLSNAQQLRYNVKGVVNDTN